MFNLRGRILGFRERFSLLRNWYMFVWPLSLLRGNRLAVLRNGARFILRGSTSPDFAMLIDIAARNDLGIESFDGMATIADVGAHIGIFTILVARLNPSSRIIAIEPEEENYALLVQNISLNGLKNVTSIRALVSDESGIGRLYVSASNVGHSMVENLHSLKERGDFQEVKMITLNSLGSIDAIKIDVEGAEYQLFRNVVPDSSVVVLDVHEVRGEEIEDLLMNFKERYTLITLGKGKVGNSRTVKMIRKS